MAGLPCSPKITSGSSSFQQRQLCGGRVCETRPGVPSDLFQDFPDSSHLFPGAWEAPCHLQGPLGSPETPANTVHGQPSLCLPPPTAILQQGPTYTTTHRQRLPRVCHTVGFTLFSHKDTFCLPFSVQINRLKKHEAQRIKATCQGSWLLGRRAEVSSLKASDYFFSALLCFISPKQIFLYFLDPP